MQIPLHLETGKLLARPNRFVFKGVLEGRQELWHCPVTGSIGGLKDFTNLPCLIEPCKKDGRRTTGTVEAISLNGGKSWIGIDQNRINTWVEELLRTNTLAEVLPCNGATVRHEVKIGGSRIDLAVEKDGMITYVEVKTPTHHIFLPGTDPYQYHPSSSQFFERLIRHFNTLANLAASGHRTIVLLCFMYDAPPFVRPPRDRWNAQTIDTINHSLLAGVENWQVNFAITPRSLRVLRMMRLDMHAEPPGTNDPDFPPHNG
jgi:sugar fermentation stimulation protein A